MRSKVPLLIVLLLIISILPGCIKKEDPKEIPDPVVGDFILTISLDNNHVNESPASLLLRVTLLNNCDHDLEIDQNLSLGTNLNVSIVKSDGREIRLDPPFPSDDIEYTKLKPGENVSTTIDLVEMVDKNNTNLRWNDFSWQIPGEYWINLTYNGTKNMLNITSNNFTLHLDEIDPLVDIIPPDSLPSIIVAHIDYITRYRYNEKVQNYLEEITIDADNPRSLIDKDGYYYFVENNGIRKVDHDLKPISEIYLEKMGVMVENDGIFYFSANGSFYTCNADLKILSSLYLNTTTDHGIKTVHDIVICNNTAFLVDNLIYPLWIFKVDVTDPQNISIIQRIEVEGVNHHLYHQWLDIEKDRWMIIQTGYVIWGHYEDIIFFSMENGTEISHQNIYRASSSDTYENGSLLKSIFSINPTWCLTAQGYRGGAVFQISNISIDNDEVEFIHQLDLLVRNDTYIFCYSNIEQHDHILFASVDDNLRLVDMSGDLDIIFGQTLDYYIRDFIIIDK